MKYLLILLVAACSFAFTASDNLRSSGMASSYPTTANGQITASGEIYDAHALTASHADLPFGTIVRVTNLRNNETVDVKINDRFPFKTNRVIDLSASAAKKIHLFSNVAPLVSIEVLEYPKEETKAESNPAPEG